MTRQLLGPELVKEIRKSSPMPGFTISVVVAGVSAITLILLLAYLVSSAAGGPMDFPPDEVLTLGILAAVSGLTMGVATTNAVHVRARRWQSRVEGDLRRQILDERDDRGA